MSVICDMGMHQQMAKLFFLHPYALTQEVASDLRALEASDPPAAIHQWNRDNKYIYIVIIYCYYILLILYCYYILLLYIVIIYCYYI